MLNVAIIGAGQVADTVHVPQYKKYPEEVKVMAVANWHLDKAKDFAQRHGIPYYFSDVEEMLQTVPIDVVSVCTPNRFHYEHVMQALKHRKDVICEKPPAMTAHQASEMAEFAEQQGCVLAYHFHHRFADEVEELKEAIAKGVLGEVYVADAIALRRSGVPGWGRFTEKSVQGGGPLIDIGIHMLDTLFYVLDYPKVERISSAAFQKIGTKKSEGTLGEWDPDIFTVEDAAFAFIRCEGGLLIRVETSYALHIKEESEMNVRLMGDKAGATLFPLQIYTDDAGELVLLKDHVTMDDKRHEKCFRNFIDACQGKDVMLADGRQGYFIQSLVEKIYHTAGVYGE